MERKIRNLKGEVYNACPIIDKILEEIKGSKIDIDNITEAFETLREICANLRNDKNLLEDEIDDLNKKIDKQADEISRLEDKNSDLQQELREVS